MQRFDLTYPLGDSAFKALQALAPGDVPVPQKELFGHVGTHLDLMGQTYPERYFRLSGRAFDGRHISGRDIAVADIDMECIAESDFVFFNSGCLASLPYASKEFLFAPVQLSWELIHALLEKKVAMIGIDFGGVRLPREHRKADTLCAAAGTFVVENVYGLEDLIAAAGTGVFTVHCYPLRLTDATGLPCRVIAEV
jgi:kynurenine formamidase